MEFTEELSSDTIFNRIEELQKNINDFSLRLVKCNWFEKWIKGKRINNKIEGLRLNQLNLVDEYLIRTNEEFRQMVDENYSCFNPIIKFKVSIEGVSVKGTYTEKMKGKIHRNGCAYIETVNTNADFGLFDRFTYPKVMSGKIDFWGDIVLVTEKVGQSLFRSTPTDLDGMIFNNNQLKVEIVKTGFEPYNNHVFMDKIVGYVIEEDEKIELFFSNKSKLEDIRDAFILKLNQEN
ncbi:MAG TPA: hypothetical protein VGF79_08625 [Bacteroidia bacterium]